MRGMHSRKSKGVQMLCRVPRVPRLRPVLHEVILAIDPLSHPAARALAPDSSASLPASVMRDLGLYAVTKAVIPAIRGKHTFTPFAWGGMSEAEAAPSLLLHLQQGKALSSPHLFSTHCRLYKCLFCEAEGSSRVPASCRAIDTRRAVQREQRSHAALPAT